MDSISTFEKSKQKIGAFLMGSVGTSRQQTVIPTNQSYFERSDRKPNLLHWAVEEDKEAKGVKFLPMEDRERYKDAATTAYTKF